VLTEGKQDVVTSGIIFAGRNETSPCTCTNLLRHSLCLTVPLRPLSVLYLMPSLCLAAVPPRTLSVLYLPVLHGPSLLNHMRIRHKFTDLKKFRHIACEAERAAASYIFCLGPSGACGVTEIFECQSEDLELTVE